MADLYNARVNGARLWDSLMGMAKIDATPKGGCNRLTTAGANVLMRAALENAEIVS